MSSHLKFKVLLLTLLFPVRTENIMLIMEKHNTNVNDYTLTFSSVSNKESNIYIFDHSENIILTVKISLDDSDLGFLSKSFFDSKIADLIDLAVAIHAADRLVPQDPRKEQIRIHVILPVRNPGLMNCISFKEKLSELLEWTTGSRWRFTFETRMDAIRIVEKQTSLPIVNVTEVVLWSGGLDALAGLYNRIKENQNASFMLFGTGSNDNTYSRQAKLFQKIAPLFPDQLHLCRVPIRFSDTGQYQKNKISRARGIVFTLMGAACACLMGKRSLNLYENGIGAINLPFRKSSVGLDHSRSVHPFTLLKVGDVISELLEEVFTINNPFLFWTKAEMCKELAKDRQDDLVSSTNSCDSPHRQQPTQCGYCSSCILRKQAVIASGLTDKTQYVVPHSGKRIEKSDLHMKTMLHQVSTLKSLLGNSCDPSINWQRFAQRFTEVDDIADRICDPENLPPAKIRESLMRLYQAYVSEWDSVEKHIQSDFLK